MLHPLEVFSGFVSFLCCHLAAVLAAIFFLMVLYFNGHQNLWFIVCKIAQFAVYLMFLFKVKNYGLNDKVDFVKM